MSAVRPRRLVLLEQDHVGIEQGLWRGQARVRALDEASGAHPVSLHRIAPVMREATVATALGEPGELLALYRAALPFKLTEQQEHAIDEIRNEPRWQAARDASINLCAKCRQCKFMDACGGGYLPHRYSKKNGYDNPSVYCDDLYSIV